MKQILINASQREELRLAIVEDNKLAELDIDLPSKNIKSNIYKVTISRVEPSLEAAFVNFGRSRHGFLPFKEISQFTKAASKLGSTLDIVTLYMFDLMFFDGKSISNSANLLSSTMAKRNSSR
jgi:Ribonuclease G/E